MAKRKVESQSANLIFDQEKLRMALNYMRACGMPHIVGKLPTKATTLL